MFAACVLALKAILFTVKAFNNVPAAFEGGDESEEIQYIWGPVRQQKLFNMSTEND